MTETNETTDGAQATAITREALTTPRSTWAFSADNLRQNIAPYAPEAKQLLVDCFLHCIKNSVTQKEFAKAIRYSPNTVYKVYTGKYTHPTTGERLNPPADMVTAMRNFLSEEKKRAQLGDTEFVETQTARKIFSACEMARESRTPVFIWGPSHIGKTWALERYTSEHNHTRTIYIRLKAAAGLGGMLHRIAECVGVSSDANKEELVGRIKNALAPNQLLILDEMHQLLHTYRKQSFFACLEVLREIYDEVKCGMVLCGTILFKNSVENGRNADLEQFYRRGVHKFRLPDFPTAWDVRAILAASGLEMPAKTEAVKIGKIVEQPYEIVRVVTRNEGLKALTERIRYARKLGNGTVTWEAFVKAHLYIAAEDMNDFNDWS